MKKKLKIAIIIILIFVLSALIFFGLHYLRLQKQKDIKSGSISNEEKDKETKYNNKYIELENIPLGSLNYGLSEMIEDRYYIVMNSNTVYHKEELDKFIENVENNMPDKIRIVQYTIEGQPILTDLEYIDNQFILKVDRRWDGYASEEDKKITVNEYDSSKYKLVKDNTPNVITNLKTYYSLDLKSIETNEVISICDYAEVKQMQKDKFKIQFTKDTENEGRTKILGKEEIDKYNYDIYSYKGKVSILIDGEEMSLRDALINNKITAQEILEKAHKDAKEDGIIYGDIYLDGGSGYYIYDDYSILKYNTLSGNKDLYIGVPSMNINDINKL